MSGIKGRRTEKEKVEGKNDKATCKIGEIRRKKHKNNTNKDKSGEIRLNTEIKQKKTPQTQKIK